MQNVSSFRETVGCYCPTNGGLNVQTTKQRREVSDREFDEGPHSDVVTYWAQLQELVLLQIIYAYLQ